MSTKDLLKNFEERMSLKEIPLDPQKSHKLKQKLTETVD